MRFVDRHVVRVAVNGRAGRKHQVPDTGIHHGLQEGKGGRDIVLVILAGHADRLAHLDERGKVEHGVETANTKQHIQGGFVGDVQFHPLDAGAGRDQVRHHHLMARNEQVLDHVRANVACATDNQKLHPCLLDSAVVQPRFSATGLW
ncbi:hypothetical protein D3C71_1485370 [compost metagenome]